MESMPYGGIITVTTDNGEGTCVNGGIDCTIGEMAANDIFLWDQQAAATLPNGQVNVVFDNGVIPPTYTITITWTEPGEVLNYTVAIPVLGI